MEGFRAPAMASFSQQRKGLATATRRRPINVNALSGPRMKQRSNHQVDQKQDGHNEEQKQRTCFHR